LQIGANKCQNALEIQIPASILKKQNYNYIEQAMNPESAPLISIIVAVYNSKETLQQCIDSVAQQHYQNKELIIIDGGSTDGTSDLLERNRDKFKYFISEPDCGIYNAWNKGLAQAHGEWVCFLGADDYFWDASVLKKLALELEKIPSGIRVAYGQIMALSVEGRELYSQGVPWSEAKRHFRHYMSIPHPAVMHRKSLFEQRGKFDESFRIAGDYELLLRELKAGEAAFIPHIMVTGVRIGGISTLPGSVMNSLRELGRAQRMHGQILPSRYLMKAMGKECVRLILWKVLGDRAARMLLNIYKRIKGLPSSQKNTRNIG